MGVYTSDIRNWAITASWLTQSTDKLLWRWTASTGAIEEITLWTWLSLDWTTLNAEWWGWWEDEFSNIWNSWSAKTIDWSTSNNQIITISEATTLTQSNLPNWQTCYLKIIDWWNFDITWAGTINWAWWFAPNLTEDWVDFLTFKYDWTNIYADFWYNFT